MSEPVRSAVAAEREYSDRKIVFDYCSGPAWPPVCRTVSGLAAVSESIIRKSKCSTDFKRNDFLKKNEAYPLGALRSLKFAYRKLRISLFVELAV